MMKKGGWGVCIEWDREAECLLWWRYLRRFLILISLAPGPKAPDMVSSDITVFSAHNNAPCQRCKLQWHRCSLASPMMDKIQQLSMHSCQPLLGVNLSPEFVNLYFPYVGQGLLLFCWWQQCFEFQLARVAVEGKSSDVENTHAQLKISLLTRFLSLLF